MSESSKGSKTSKGSLSSSGSASGYVPRLKTKYLQVIRPALIKKYGYRNVMQVPKFEKVVLNMGLGEAVADPKIIEAAVADLAAIAGQKPLVTRARKAISTFKLREGMPIGVKVTLRGERMYEFLDALATYNLSRIRDFRGIDPKGFDGRGNYSMGIKEHLIFPTVNYDKGVQNIGLGITICTTAVDNGGGHSLMELSGFPFIKKNG